MLVISLLLLLWILIFLSLWIVDFCGWNFCLYCSDLLTGDAPEWMEVQSYLSPRGTVPNKPGRGSNDLGIQGYRAVNAEQVSKGAAGRHTGLLADDSAVSSDLPGNCCQVLYFVCFDLPPQD